MQKICLYCGDPYEAVRSTRKFCSNSCKSKYHDLNREIQSDFSSANDMIVRLSAKAKKFPDKQSDIFPYVEKLAKSSLTLYKQLKQEIES